MNKTSYLSLSDDEFLNQSAQEEEEQNPEPEQEEEEQNEDASETSVEALEEASEGEGYVPTIKPPEEPVEALEEPEEASEPEQVDMGEFYNRLTSPFKANGKTLQFQNAEDILSLMQQGANYTQKMQQIAPYRKVIATLEKHGLLDEEKINYLIDLSKQDKGAITKLLKDSKTDPLELGLEEEGESSYTPANHHLSEQEMVFNDAVNEVMALPQGRELIQTVHQNWDKQSKDILWEQPNTLYVLQEQKESGLYDYVVEEIEKARMLGKVHPTAPFIAVYRDVSEHLYKLGKLNRFLRVENQYNPKPVAKTVQKKPSVGNHRKASAASSGHVAKSSTGAQLPNPLAMSDEEFLKLMAQEV